MVQWLGLSTLTAEGLGSIPGQGTKTLKTTWCGQNKPKIESPCCMPQTNMTL